MAALYQQARPRTFDQLVGQEHVREVLVAAIRRERVGHAYLFSGPRGVGKTTTARLLAMAVNCEAPAEQRPCGQCESCRLIQEGTHPDVIELDAASNNSVEDVRELREKVRLASLRGGMRVWILDEAHMLSRAAANALLKTLEEPPAGLVFVLATTEPEKLPPTILSRCQHFRFRRLGDDEIRSKLEQLSQAAGVAIDAEALALVARSADGAMRDAESLLERLLAAGRPVDRQLAEEALGLPPGERLEALAGALLDEQLEQLFTIVSALYHDGFAPRTVAEQLGRTLRDALHAAVLGESSGAGAEAGASPAMHPRERLLTAIHALDDELERFVRHNDLYALEVALIKTMNALAGRSAGGGSAVASDEPDVPASSSLPAFDPHARPPAAGSRAPAPAPTKTAAPARAVDGAASPTQNSSEQASVVDADASAAHQRPPLNWHAIKSHANAQLKAFLMPARESIEGDRIIIRFSDTHAFHFRQLCDRRDELAALVEEIAGPGYQLVIEGPGESVTKKP